ncbi:MAG: hypothetical protein ABI680_04955 [Chthoniobacteraceae bacterium]
MKTSIPLSTSQLPGGEYLAEGLADLETGKESLSALLLSIAASRLTAAGLSVPPIHIREPELRLYRLLRVTHQDDAHSQYNAHLRRLTSLCHALESRPS